MGKSNHGTECHTVVESQFDGCLLSAVELQPFVFVLGASCSMHVPLKHEDSMQELGERTAMSG